MLSWWFVRNADYFDVDQTFWAWLGRIENHKNELDHVIERLQSAKRLSIFVPSACFCYFVSKAPDLQVSFTCVQICRIVSVRLWYFSNEGPYKAIFWPKIYKLQENYCIFWMQSSYLSALDFWHSLVWNVEFDELDFFSSLNWIFASYTGSKNPV